MGLDALFYRLAVTLISAFTACACGVIVARSWLKIGAGTQQLFGRGAAEWLLAGEMISNLAFIICARAYSGDSQRVFDHLWIACLSVSASLTLAAVVVCIRSTSRTGKMFKVRMALLVLVNLLGAASLLMRY